MTPYVTITLEGTPIGKGRARFGQGHVYTPSQTGWFEQALGLKAKEAMRGKNLLEGPVQIVMTACFPIPRAWPKWKHTAAIERRIFPVGKPDADNILKTIDGLNAIVWADDRQVIDAHIRKFYTANPHVMIEVYKLEEYRRDVD